MYPRSAKASDDLRRFRSCAHSAVFMMVYQVLVLHLYSLKPCNTNMYCKTLDCFNTSLRYALRNDGHYMHHQERGTTTHCFCYNARI